MRRLAVSIIALGLLLTALSFAVPVVAIEGHCPDQNGNPGKDESGADDNDLVLEAGLTICIHSSNANTGLIQTDGTSTLCDYLFAEGIKDGSGTTCSDVSYWIDYDLATPTPTPSPTPTGTLPPPPTPTPSPTPTGTPPTASLFSVSTCPETGEVVATGQSIIRFEHPFLVLLLLNVRVDGELVTLRSAIEAGVQAGDVTVSVGVHDWSISNPADTEVLASGTVNCPECNPAEASPTPPPAVPTEPTPAPVPPTVPDTAMPVVQGVGLVAGTALLLLGLLLVLNSRTHARRK